MEPTTDGHLKKTDLLLTTPHRNFQWQRPIPALVRHSQRHNQRPVRRPHHPKLLPRRGRPTLTSPLAAQLRRTPKTDHDGGTSQLHHRMGLRSWVRRLLGTGFTRPAHQLGEYVQWDSVSLGSGHQSHHGYEKAWTAECTGSGRALCRTTA